MEKTRKRKDNAPKTIRIKYPAPYSPQPSTKADADNPLAPKPSKRKTRISSFSAQTWKDKEKKAGKMKLTKTRPASTRQTQSQLIANKKNNPRCPRRLSVQFGPGAGPGPRLCRPPIRRLDPSALHLKYGVFPPPKKPSLIGNLSNAVISKPPLRRRLPRIETKSERKPIPKSQEVMDIAEAEEAPSDVPTLVIRPISNVYAQRLSASDVFHLDIKPGVYRIGSPRLPKITVM